MSDPYDAGSSRSGVPNIPAPAAAPESARDAARRGFNFRPVNLLLLVPLIGVLVPSWFNSSSPEWGGMPFFYWYQLVWIPFSVIFTYIVYRSTRGER